MSKERHGVMDASYAQGRTEKLSLSWRLRARARAAADAYQSLSPGLPPSRILSMGAAEGRTLVSVRDLLNPAATALGIEHNQALIDAAGTLPPGVTLRQGDVMALPPELGDDSFDLVVALAVLEHLPRPAEAVREAFRVLRPGGVFVATCPNPLWDEIAGHLGLVADEHHEVALDRKALRGLTQEAGFTRVVDLPFMWVPAAALPYAGVDVPLELARRLDQLVGQLPYAGVAFVNQLVAARKG